LLKIGFSHKMKVCANPVKSYQTFLFTLITIRCVKKDWCGFIKTTGL